MGDKHILWMICAFSRFIKGVVIPNKSAEEVIQALHHGWCLQFSFPSRGFWADNGTEFKNEKLEEFSSRMGFTVKFGPPYNPWSNGVNERNHYSADITVKKLADEKGKDIKNVNKRDLQMLVDLSSWTHNTNVSNLGHVPLQIVTGKAVIFPGISNGSEATEAESENEAINRRLENMRLANRHFREVEFQSKMDKALKTRIISSNNILYHEGDLVLYQTKDRKNWLGPVPVQHASGNEVFIKANGDLKKVGKCRVMPFKTLNNFNIGEEENEEDTSPEGILTRSKKKIQFDGEVKESDVMYLDKEKSGTFNEQRKQSEVGEYPNSSENESEQNVYAVEIPPKDHDKPEVRMAKEKEVENLMRFDTFVEVDDEGQSTIGSRWVITQKEFQDGQKEQFKARLVARGFQEECKPQSDSPTAQRESLKLFLAMCAICNVETLKSVDIKAAFLQADKLDRDIFMQVPKDIRKKGKLWKLLKPLYGLDDASRKFWLRIKSIFAEEGLETVPGDQAFYIKRDETGKVIGFILTHVDDFLLAGSESFVSNIIEKLKQNLAVSKVEDKKFRFTGVDVELDADRLILSMNDYAKSIVPIENVRKGKKNDPLNDEEKKTLRRYIGKLSWLSENTRPDLAYATLKLSQSSQQTPTLGDLKTVNNLVKKVTGRSSEVIFTRVGDPEDVVVFGIGDASHRRGEKAIGGELIVIGNKYSPNAVPIYWKSKTIQNVCKSPKDAETRNINRLVDNTRYMANQIGFILFGKKDKTSLPVRSFTDSLPLLESIASIHRVEERLLQDWVDYLKERLETNDVEFYSWLDTDDMLADMLTKEMKESSDMIEILWKNYFRLYRSADNKVAYANHEFKISNRKIKNSTTSSA